MTEEAVLVCSRVVDLPFPPILSVRKRCGNCSAEVWASHSGLAQVGEDAPIICLQCFYKTAPPDFTMGKLSQEILAELAAHGISEKRAMEILDSMIQRVPKRQESRETDGSEAAPTHLT